MKMKWLSGILMGMVVLLLATGCRPEECEVTLPIIGYKDFIQFQDSSGQLTITFSDCDGDIGLKDSDTLPPYEPGGGNYHNLKLEYFEMVDGNWQQVSLLIPFYYRVPYLEPDGQNKTLDGEILVDLTPWYFNPFSNDSDTIKFELTLQDRDLNISNVVATRMIIVPK